MLFRSLLTTTILSATTLAAPATSSTRRQVDTSNISTYQIEDLSVRKYDGQTISTMSFNILATNGGTLDFTCVPYDPVTDSASQQFEAGKVYFCGKNSSFSFAYDPATTDACSTNRLYLWQQITDTYDYSLTISGSTSVEDGICRAGGSSIDDLICTVPDVAFTAIVLHEV